MSLSYQKFLKTLPTEVIPLLPAPLQGIKVRQPWRWLVQFHYGEPRLHYEVSRAQGQTGLELGFHCEARDRDLNRYMLNGFRHNLFEIKDSLGERFEAEMWDKGWTKIYEVYPEGDLSEDYRAEVGARLSEIIVCLHPIYVELRGQVARIYR
jgi:hypothetical protein